MSIINKKIIFLFLAISLVVLMGAGCNPFQKDTPEQVLTKMMEAMSSAQSFAFNIAANVGNQPAENENPGWQFDLTLNGKGNTASLTEARSQLKMDGNYSTSGNTLSFAGEIRMLDKKTYFQITEMPALPFLNLEELKNQWYLLNQSQLADELSNLNLNINSPTEELTEDEFQQIKQLIENSSFFQITNGLEEEEIGGVKCYHYEVKLDQEGITKFMEELAKISEQPLTNEIRDGLDEAFKNISDLKAEIWIGKKDFLLHRINITGSLPQENKTEKIVLDIAVQFSDFNQPVEVSAPEESAVLDLEKILGDTMKGMFSQTLMGEEDLSKDSDDDGLVDYLETMYQTDPNNSDTDGDGFSDGEEVLNGYNPNGEGQLEIPNYPSGMPSP